MPRWPVSPRSSQTSASTAAPIQKSSQKFACQPKAASRRPPMAGLIIGTTAMPMVTKAIMEPARSAGTMSRTTARPSTMPTAALAWIIRKTRKTVALGAQMQPRVATQKMARPASTTGRRPRLSATGPTRTWITALTAR